MNREYALVILAAGIGSRFGGVKQLKKVGPGGEIIMDYSIYDAIRAGFNKIVFIIRKDIEADFREVIGDRVEALCAQRGVEVAYAYQERTDLPGGYICPAERTKPWGTGHALLVCKGLLNGPFVVLNADDYYGQSAFDRLLAYLKSLPEDSEGRYCMAGFRLGNTLSDFGGVTRGVCVGDGDANLRKVTETRSIIKTPEGCAARIGTLLKPLDMDACVSMNMWGFTPDILGHLEIHFCRFLRQFRTEPKSEFLLPDVVDQLLVENLANVKILPPEDQWFGMTYQEDVPLVSAAFHALAEEGRYQPGLY